MLKVAERAVKEALRKGAEQADAIVVLNDYKLVYYERNELKGAEESRIGGCGIRSVIGKKYALSYSNSLEQDDVLRAVENSVKLARVVPEDGYFKTLPSPPEGYPRVSQLFDKDLEGLSLSDLIRLGKESVQSALEVESNADVSCSVHTTVFQIAIVSSLGISCEAKVTTMGVSVDSKLEVGGELGYGWEHETSRMLNEVDHLKVGRTASEKARTFLGPKKVPTGTMDLILDFDAALSFSGGILGALSGLEVLRKRSYLTGKLGEAILPSFVTIVDRGIMDGGAAPFDGEGCARRNTVVIEKGFLKSYLHNSYTAMAMGHENTGNAARGYNTRPGVMPTRIDFQPGDWSLDEMMKEVERGIYVDKAFLIAPDVATGEMSAQIDDGLYVENGEVKFPVKQVMVGGRWDELFKGIKGLSKDRRERNRNFVPRVLISGVKVAGGA
ncbi:MAG: TldD/PmbA family protein [Candidatus Brockarchaeota archaeon]|nr:TldD/PmbA family protein [Candidatus Brockarchaeota archaeon]